VAVEFNEYVTSRVRRILRHSVFLCSVHNNNNNNNNNKLLLLLLLLFTAVGLLPGGSGYFTCKQNMKSVTTKFKSGWLHEKHVVATWNLGNHLSVCL